MSEEQQQGGGARTLEHRGAEYRVVFMQGPRVAVRLAGDEGAAALLTPNQLRALADAMEAVDWDALAVER